MLNPLSGRIKAMMDFLRKATYELLPAPDRTFGPGSEFEDRHRADR
jgi:hypothetical protein